MPIATSRTDGTPKCAATAPRSAVSGPRPSSARIAHHSAAWPSPCPPPQSPVVSPSARNPVFRPSGATPTQLMPAPQVTATPPGGAGRGGGEEPAGRGRPPAGEPSAVLEGPAAGEASAAGERAAGAA